MLAKEILNVLLCTVKRNKCFALIGDEGATCDNKTVLSMAFRTVDINLKASKLFMGVFLLFNLKAETIAAKLTESTQNELISRK